MTVPSVPYGQKLLAACQVRAARAMMKFSLQKLAAQSGVSESSLRRIEAVFGVPDNVSVDLLFRLHAYFESVGFEFSWNDDKPCVCWHRYPDGRPHRYPVERETRQTR